MGIIRKGCETPLQRLILLHAVVTQALFTLLCIFALERGDVDRFFLAHGFCCSAIFALRPT